jgi:hypothetical protein
MFIRLAENLSAVSFAQRGRRVTYVIDICFYTSMKLVSHTANEESILSWMMPWNHVEIRLVECLPIERSYTVITINPSLTSSIPHSNELHELVLRYVRLRKGRNQR